MLEGEHGPGGVNGDEGHAEKMEAGIGQPTKQEETAPLADASRSLGNESEQPVDTSEHHRLETTKEELAPRQQLETNIADLQAQIEKRRLTKERLDWLSGTIKSARDFLTKVKDTEELTPSQIIEFEALNNALNQDNLDIYSEPLKNTSEAQEPIAPKPPTASEEKPSEPVLTPPSLEPPEPIQEQKPAVATTEQQSIEDKDEPLTPDQIRGYYQPSGGAGVPTSSETPGTWPVSGKPTETVPHDESDEAFTRKEAGIFSAVNARRAKTEKFVEKYITPFHEAIATREAIASTSREGIGDYKEMILAGWRMKRAERHIRTEIAATQTTLAKAREKLAGYEASYARIYYAFDRLSRLAASRPGMESRIQDKREQLLPRITELSNLIEMQKAYIQEVGSSLKTMAGGIGMELEPDEGIGHGEKGVPVIPGSYGSAESEAGGLPGPDDYYENIRGRIENIFATGEHGPSAKGQRMSAVDKFFRFILGYDMAPKPVAQGAK